MRKYDPERTPDPKEWLELDEGERMNLISSFHRSAGPKLPNPQLHAVFHVVVENQIAMGEEVPVRTLRRLQDEGLDRHEAVHAIGSVLAEQIYSTLSGVTSGIDVNRRYARKLESLTAEKWRKSG